MPLPSSGPRVVFSALRNGTWRNDLIKRLIAGDHAEIAAGALFQRLHTVLQIAYFSCELPIALAKLVVFGPLRRYCRLETTQLANTVFGKPYTVLQEHHDDEQCCGKPLHERDSLSDAVPRAKRGATHASHGLTREGQPWTVSRRSLRNGLCATPRGNYLVQCAVQGDR